MSTSTGSRALVALALAFAALARPLTAQSSRIAVADADRVFVSPGMRGFELRRHGGFGHFITDSVLRAASGSRLSLLLGHRVPSLFFAPGAYGGEFPLSSRVCGAGSNCLEPRCYTRVFIDGSLVFDGTTRMRDVEGVDFGRLRTEDFSGIEYYSSAAGLPSQYAGQNTDCGTLLMWSREN